MGRDMTTERNTILAAFFSGLRRVLSTPALVLWVYLACLLAALPLTFVIGQTLRNSIGASLVEQKLRRGFDVGWWGEFEFYNHGLADTFGPWVVGHLLPVSHLERLLDGEILEIDPGLTLTGVLFLCLLAFLTGGILDRYARPGERHSRSHLFSSGSRYFFRLLRLLLISVGLYWLLFRYAWDPLQDWLEWATRDITAERTIIIYTFLVYALIGASLMAQGMVFDYARVAMVAEHRRSAVLSLGRGLVFVLKRPLPCAGLYLSLSGVSVLVLGLYMLIAPGPNQGTVWTIGFAFLVSQLYIVARVTTRLWFLASQMDLFQSSGALEGVPTGVDGAELS